MISRVPADIRPFNMDEESISLTVRLGVTTRHAPPHLLGQNGPSDSSRGEL
jgi:hypothetical protein